MKLKKIIFLVFSMTLSVFLFAQQNLGVDVNDKIYDILDICQARGLCDFITVARPYTQRQIVRAFQQALESEEGLSESERQLLLDYIEKTHENDKKVISPLKIYLQNEKKSFPLSFNYNLSFETQVTGGLYTDSSVNSFGFDFYPKVDFYGDIGNRLSYRMFVLIDITRMPLQDVADDYLIGYSWYDKWTYTDEKGWLVRDENGKVIEYDWDDYMSDEKGIYPEPQRRLIRKKKNNSSLPFAYRKQWGGQIYYLENLDASGLEGWPETVSLTGNILGDIRASFFDDKFIVGIGRIARDWASMDSGSSLVLNSNAQPFTAFDMSVQILSFVKFSNLTGILEYPNQDYINANSYPEKLGSTDDSFFFQNAFSMSMVELDLKYFHCDFGCSVVYPKRFELGYIFPLANYTEYQNHIGDYDNCALFGDIKFRKPGLGSIWASLYVDEVNGLQNNPITDARDMFAGQLGVKIILPKIPFGSISMRYTKVEPYCYTHHSINYTPWYSHYVYENYTNSGEPLGYYLPPNSDEFFLRFETTPKFGFSLNFQYQFIRHGADYGSQQVPGSSLYSELSPQNRNDITKHFLHDGAYNWMHIVSLGGTYSFNKTKVPVSLFGNFGFLYSYYTMLDDENYELSMYGNRKASSTTQYHFVDNDEYPVQCGVVLTAGIRVLR